MKVLILTTHLNAGGITSYLLTLCQNLIKKECELFIVSSGGDKENEFSSIGVILINMDIRTKSELSLKVYKNILPLNSFIKENQIDMIHAQTRVTQVLAQYLKAVCQVPVVTTCHGFFKRRVFRRMFPCWGDQVIAVSSAVESHLIQDFKVNPNRIKLIPNGINVSQFKSLSREEKIILRKKFDLGDELLIGLTARLSDVKGQDILIKAFKKIMDKVPNAKLLLVGKGKLEKDLRALVQDLKLHKHVIFRITTENVMEYLSILDVFAAPSRQEGLGLSILEAQASGLPVVASRVGGIPSIIKEEETGLLVEPEDVDGFAEAVLRVLRDCDLARKLSQKGKEFVEKNFSAIDMAEQTRQLYQEQIWNRIKK